MENQNLEINLPRALRNHSLVASLVGLGVFGLLAYRTIREPLKYQSDSLILIANQNTVPLVPPLREDNPDQKKDAQANDIEILKSRALLRMRHSPASVMRFVMADRPSACATSEQWPMAPSARYG